MLGLIFFSFIYKKLLQMDVLAVSKSGLPKEAIKK